jgi:hypothetical protein
MQRMLLGLCLFMILPNLSGQLTETGKRVSLTDGNELHSWCQAYKDAIKTKDDGFYLQSTDVSTGFDAGGCMGYVRGVVDSLPTGGDFSPGPKVKLTQYVDVVFKYLEEHPELRDKPAHILAEDALSRAFPKK